jgi:hypothetical protein
MEADLASLSLKTSYSFKEARIPVSHDRNSIHERLRQTVAPAIRDLESQRLINGFHHIIHENIDLRLSCDEWPNKEPAIKDVLALHGIPTELRAWGPMPSERYGGELGVLLCYNNLEYNSRLTLALVELIAATHDDTLLHWQDRLCPHQWVHYLCNQFGYLNPAQIQFELEDAFVWLRTLLANNPGNPQAISFARSVMNELKNRVAQFEQSIPND